MNGSRRPSKSTRKINPDKLDARHRDEKKKIREISLEQKGPNEKTLERSFLTGLGVHRQGSDFNAGLAPYCLANNCSRLRDNLARARARERQREREKKSGTKE